MKITPDVILRASSFLNPCGEREIDLHGRHISYIHNLAILNDKYGCINLADNRIEALENFPKFMNLRWILIPNNRISRIDKNISQCIPNLSVLILSDNHIALLSEIDKLRNCKHLTVLNLDGCPVQKCENYRLYVIYKLPRLITLDNNRIYGKERAEATAKFGSIKGSKYIKDLADQAVLMSEENHKVMASSAELTAVQKKVLRSAVMNATTPAEVERIEAMIKSGIVEDTVIRNNLVGNSKDINHEDSTDSIASTAVKEHAAAPLSSTNLSSGSTTDVSKAASSSEASAEIPKGLKRALSDNDETETSGKYNEFVNTNDKKKLKMVDGSPEAPSLDDNAAEDNSVKKDEVKSAVVDIDWVNGLRVLDLKKELKKRKVDPKGKKADLQRQLIEAMTVET